ncbi:MAG TPA: L,D-transpeptidase [Baekduia sp.]|nr:L,D-transpeptidase [Baekduia sp.]
MAAAILAAIAAGTATTQAQAAPASQELVVLLAGKAAYAAPASGARVVASVPGRRPLTRIRTVLPVVGRATAANGAAWLRVRLSGRPSQPLGWIRATRTRSTQTPWRLRLTISSRRLTVYHYGRAVRRFAAIVGAPSTPTPIGEFFVEEALRLSGGAVGGPFALATSARSTVLQEFAGGPGQIAIHGMGNLSGQMGTAVSHGCIRLSYASITWLAGQVGRGVPLTIVR